MPSRRVLVSPQGGGGGGGGLTFVPNGSYALSGTIAEGNLLTLSGTGFGAVGPQLLYYKNYANETLNTRCSHGPDFIDSALCTAAANGNGYAYCAAGAGMPYGQGMIISNDSRVGTVGSGGGWGGSRLTFSSLLSEVVSIQTFYFPTSCNYAPLVSAGNPQIKLDWLYANSISDTDLYDKICNQAISLAATTDSDTAPAIDGLAFGTNTQFVWGSGPYPYTGVPIRRLRWAALNAAPGSSSGNILYLGVWNGGSGQTVDVAHNNLVMAASGSSNNGYNTLTIPGFVQDTSATNPNWSYDNNYYVIQGETYIAAASSGNTGAVARIEIGDASTYAACAHLSTWTVESPSWWGNAAVQARARGGVFYQNMANTYVYVTTASNVTTQVGQIV